MKGLVFAYWFKPWNNEGWTLLEQECKLQLGFRDKPRWLPRFLWRFLIKCFIVAMTEGEIRRDGYFEQDTLRAKIKS